MIIVTGSAGFIGSQMAIACDKDHRIMLVDDPDLFREHGYFGPQTPSQWDHARDVTPENRHNIVDHRYFLKVLEKLIPTYQDETKAVLPAGESITAVFHIGAITDTSRTRDIAEMRQWNTEYSKSIWKWCAEHNIPFIYASSAATYGLGENEFTDEHSIVPKLQPLNPYAISKHEFDCWALEQVASGKPAPQHWYGLKFFNVYGPNEGHKGRMASTILHSFRALSAHGDIPLFRSHRDGIADGEQKRDFIHVDDVVKVMRFCSDKLPPSGIYNLGTGQARSFRDMTKVIFQTMEQSDKIRWIDTPQEFREFYQYFTQADMTKLKAAGYNDEFLSLEAGVANYTRWLRSSVDRTETSNPTLH